MTNTNSNTRRTRDALNTTNEKLTPIANTRKLSAPKQFLSFSNCHSDVGSIWNRTRFSVVSFAWAISAQSNLIRWSSCKLTRLPISITREPEPEEVEWEWEWRMLCPVLTIVSLFFSYLRRNAMIEWMGGISIFNIRCRNISYDVRPFAHFAFDIQLFPRISNNVSIESLILLQYLHFVLSTPLCSQIWKRNHELIRLVPRSHWKLEHVQTGSLQMDSADSGNSMFISNCDIATTMLRSER